MLQTSQLGATVSADGRRHGANQNSSRSEVVIGPVETGGTGCAGEHEARVVRRPGWTAFLVWHFFFS